MEPKEIISSAILFWCLFLTLMIISIAMQPPRIEKDPPIFTLYTHPDCRYCNLQKNVLLDVKIATQGFEFVTIDVSTKNETWLIDQNITIVPVIESSYGDRLVGYFDTNTTVNWLKYIWKKYEVK